MGEMSVVIWLWHCRQGSEIEGTDRVGHRESISDWRTHRGFAEFSPRSPSSRVNWLTRARSLAVATELSPPDWDYDGAIGSGSIGNQRHEPFVISEDDRIDFQLRA